MSTDADPAAISGSTWGSSGRGDGAAAPAVPHAEGPPVEISAEDRASIGILVIDDERTLRESCASILETEGYSVLLSGKADEALKLMRSRRPDIVLIDLYMAEVSGLTLLQTALEVNPMALVIVMTGNPSVQSSLEAMRKGAWSYLPKPFSATHLNILIGRAAHAVLVSRESQEKSEKRDERAGHSSEITLLGQSGAFRKVIEAARQVAATDASVFITGESGTGKELFAQFIHQNSRRRSRDLVPVNSAAIPESLLESEMFGHVEGAFTGAVREKEGLLEVAHGGTLFLDELTEMPHSVQAKLLRVIQDGVVRRVGSNKMDAVVDVRFIAATNIDPHEAVKEGKLRRDLFYRLQVFPINIPPLRERPEDIPVLAQHFLERFWDSHRGSQLARPHFHDDAMAVLKNRAWHGNVRELRNAMERAVVTLEPGGEIREADLGFLDDVQLVDQPTGFADLFRLNQDYHTAREYVLAEFEKHYLQHIINRANGSISDAAEMAGVDRTTLYRLMEKHDTDKYKLLRNGEP